METRLTSYIAVPSRLYFPPRSSDLPLSGLRFGAKDVFVVAGLRSSRDFYSFYPARQQTSNSIKDLIALGAVLAGRQKIPNSRTGRTLKSGLIIRAPGIHEV